MGPRFDKLASTVPIGEGMEAAANNRQLFLPVGASSTTLMAVDPISIPMCGRADIFL